MASLLFYAWGEPKYITVMVSTCIVNYFGAVFIDTATEIKKRRLILAATVGINIATLIYFKYMNFILANLNKIASLKFEYSDVIMPIGISFYTFQAISYVVDVYRRDTAVQKNFIKMALYISFFPQLIAGPIIKYHDIVQSLNNLHSSFDDVVYGTKRFIIGLGKKVLIANSLGEVADKIFQTGYQGTTIEIAWLGAICYTLQLYFDFSGYSDMAIGLGRIFGFKFLENFNYPYIAKGITDFWRRWHISLGSWFKEYVYIPLGGNRKGKMRTYINLWIVFCITGIWHGAEWTFILWGMYHGLFIMLERAFNLNKIHKKYDAFIYLYTIVVFVIGWVIFRADTIKQGLGMIAAMLGLYRAEYVPFTLEYYVNLKLILVLIVAVLMSTPYVDKLWKEHILSKKAVGEYIENMYLLAVLFLSIVYIAASTYNPFIYFRF